jgi:ribosomal-protein-alanine N-acetyltransferase
LFGGLSEPNLYQYIEEKPPASIEWLETRYDKLEKRRSPSGGELWLNWALRDKTRQDYVGYCQSTVMLGGRASIAYVIFRERWRRGYASEAVERMLRFLRERLGVSVVFATVDLANIRSVRLLRRLGFEVSNADVATDTVFRKNLP